MRRRSTPGSRACRPRTSAGCWSCSVERWQVLPSTCSTVPNPPGSSAEAPDGAHVALVPTMLRRLVGDRARPLAPGGAARRRLGAGPGAPRRRRTTRWPGRDDLRAHGVVRRRRLRRHPVRGDRGADLVDGSDRAHRSDRDGGLPGRSGGDGRSVHPGRLAPHRGSRGRSTPRAGSSVHGRSDDAIRSGGETVWPEEVEAALRSHPGVADVAVTGAPDHEWGQRVVAWVVPGGSGAPSDPRGAPGALPRAPRSFQGPARAQRRGCPAPHAVREASASRRPRRATDPRPWRRPERGRGSLGPSGLPGGHRGGGGPQEGSMASHPKLRHPGVVLRYPNSGNRVVAARDAGVSRPGSRRA